MNLSTGWRPDALLECDLCVYDKKIRTKKPFLLRAQKAGHVFSFSTKVSAFPNVSQDTKFSLKNNNNRLYFRRKDKKSAYCHRLFPPC